MASGLSPERESAFSWIKIPFILWSRKHLSFGTKSCYLVGKLWRGRHNDRLTLIAWSSGCLRKNIMIFSSKFWDLPMWQWASGVMATASPMLVPRDDGIFEFRMWHIRASQRSIPAICFTNCFPSVRRNLALEVRCSSSPCLSRIKYWRMYLGIFTHWLGAVRICRAKFAYWTRVIA